MVSFAVARIAQPEFNDLVVIISKIWYYDKVLVIEDLHTSDKKEAMKQIHDYYMNRSKTKLQTPFYVKQFWNLQAKSPRLVGFLRNVLLQRFTVATARSKSEI